MLVGEGRHVLKILIDKIKKRLKRKYVFIQYQKWLTCDYCLSFRMYIIITLWVVHSYLLIGQAAVVYFSPPCANK